MNRLSFILLLSLHNIFQPIVFSIYSFFYEINKYFNLKCLPRRLLTRESVSIPPLFSKQSTRSAGEDDLTPEEDDFTPKPSRPGSGNNPPIILKHQDWWPNLHTSPVKTK